ncbi:MAG: CbtB domain-containing protein [Nitratireductor sp.]
MLATKTGLATVSLSFSRRIATAAFAAVFGSALLYAAAFANADLLHNSTHDTRHAVVAPCH